MYVLQMQVELTGRGMLDEESTTWSGTYTPAGAFRCETSSRFATQTTGWTGAAGTAAWERDAGGLLRTLQFDDHEALVLEASVRSGFFARPAAGGVLAFCDACAVSEIDASPSAKAQASSQSDAASSALPAHTGTPLTQPRPQGYNHDAQTSGSTPQSGLSAHRRPQRPGAQGLQEVANKAAKARKRKQARSGRKKSAAMLLDTLVSGRTARKAAKRSVWTPFDILRPGTEPRRKPAKPDSSAAQQRSNSHNDQQAQASVPSFAHDLGLEADVAFVELTMNLQGGLCRATVSIDPTTGRVRSLRQRMGTMEMWVYSRWQLWQGCFLFPSKVQHFSREQLVEEVVVEACEVAGGIDDTYFVRPPTAMWPAGARS
jgi:hypothetical protein